MKSPIDPYAQDIVLDHLGDKVISGLAESVRRTRVDLDQYRAEHPSWVASSSERGLANWISDRLWDHLVRAFDNLEEVAVREQGSTREIIIADRIRLRVKRHDRLGAIATYPTQTALSFYEQSGQLVLFDGEPEVRVAVGYVWEPESREIGAPVVSLRHGADNLIWLKELLEAPMDAAIAIPPVLEPPTPTVIARDQTEPNSARES